MRRDELTIGPLILRQAILLPFRRIGIVEELSDEIVVFIQDRDAAAQIRDQQIALLFVEMARQSNDAIIALALHKRKMFPIQARQAFHAPFLR